MASKKKAPKKVNKKLKVTTTERPKPKKLRKPVAKKIKVKTVMSDDVTYYREQLAKAREGLASAKNELSASEALVGTYERRLDELQGHH